MKMKGYIIITILGLIAMTFGLLNGFINGDLIKDGTLLLENPWGIMSMIDLYVGFVLFSMWIFYRESNKLLAFIWILLMMVLGFFTACIYLLFAFYQANNNWDIFFKGKNIQ